MLNWWQFALLGYADFVIGCANLANAHGELAIFSILISAFAFFAGAMAVVSVHEEYVRPKRRMKKYVR